MRMKNWIVFLLLPLAACSSTAPAPPGEPGIPVEKIEEIEGWIRLKSIGTEASPRLEIDAGSAEVRFTSGPNGFAVPAARYRHDAREDYAEIELGAKLQAASAPQAVGPPVFDKATLAARVADRCAGQATMNVPIWHGCGPVACEGTGEIIGVGCGGWTGADAPK